MMWDQYHTGYEHTTEVYVHPTVDMQGSRYLSTLSHRFSKIKLDYFLCDLDDAVKDVVNLRFVHVFHVTPTINDEVFVGSTIHMNVMERKSTIDGSTLQHVIFSSATVSRRLKATR